MKIEKVNDHQIRCTLTHEDLASRKLKISELAYGSKKAKDLFKDMMEMANMEYGFETDNIPLMVEAIPINSDCIVLIITKVEDPDELDTRFSKFAPGLSFDDATGKAVEDDDDDSDDVATDVHLSDIYELFEKYKDMASASSNDTQNEVPKDPSMAFIFPSIISFMDIAQKAVYCFNGQSSLYRMGDCDKYLLVIRKGKMSFSDFVKACNLLEEYSEKNNKYFSEAYISEHFEAVCKDNAIETMARL